MTKEQLINFFWNTGVFKRGMFVGKSGESYSIETDLRNAMTTYESALNLAKEINDQIEELGLSYPYIGVPETGTFLSMFLNHAYNKKTKSDFNVNMLRSEPKEYQTSTNSVNTVLPSNNTEYILIEDDVVTGGTLCKYLRRAIHYGQNIKAVVAVFGRSSAFQVEKLCEEYGIKYYELFKISEIEKVV